jgi:hypothetical protein
MQRLVFGLIGSTCKESARKQWNELLKKQGIDGFFDFYRTENRDDLVLRLSEMFLHERRGYIVAPELRQFLPELLDSVVPDTGGIINVIKNEGGLLRGYHFIEEGEWREEVLQFWLHQKS